MSSSTLICHVASENNDVEILQSQLAVRNLWHNRMDSDKEPLDGSARLAAERDG
jgi:hypothetical protein